MNAAEGKFGVWLKISISFVFMIALCLATQDIAAQEGLSNTPMDVDVHRSWQLGGFVAGGFPPFYEQHTSLGSFREELEFFNAGFESGRMLTSLHGPGFLHGRGEAVIEVIPFWLASYPKQTNFVNQTLNPQFLRDGFSNHGVSITPLLFRWNFMKQESRRFVPWAQLGSGLLWTSQNFPLGNGTGSNTSRINFTPQVDFGEEIFTKKNQSLNLAVKGVHISSAGLGEYNPGVNITVQFSLGYSWWK